MNKPLFAISHRYSNITRYLRRTIDRLILASLGLCLPQLVQADPGGTLVTPRSDHTATLLTDGRVLLAGGYDGGLAATASSEVYNPISNAWIATGNLNQGRRDHGSVLLSDGRALSMGGSTTGDV